MSEDRPTPGSDGTRTATVRTTHADAEVVTAALAPDDTDSMSTHVDGDVIVCEIERGTTGGLLSTVDDYVVNLTVADRVTARGREHGDGGDGADASSSGSGASRAPTNDTHNT